METAQIVSWLRDKAARHGDHAYQRMLTVAADQLSMLQKRVDELETQAGWPPVEQIFPGLQSAGLTKDEILQFIEAAQQAAEEKGARSFVCTICGGNAECFRADNGHLHAVCEWCGIEVVE